MVYSLPVPVASVALMGYAFFFELGVGPLPSLVGVELFQGSRHLTVAAGLATQANWLVQGAIGLVRERPSSSSSSTPTRPSALLPLCNPSHKAPC
eukprot:SAG22_NODE_3249_length_1832_cov_1.412002_2_plen_95_part_00